MNPAASAPTPGGDPFAALAPFYDLDLEGYDDDVEWYRALASEAEGAVLELGCGTGRVALALAEDGIEVVGVDISEAMLAVARERTERAGGTAPSWQQADLRDVDLGRVFQLVLVPLGGLQHMETLDDVVSAFDSIRRHLAPDGLAVVDVEAPLPDDFTPGPQPLIEHWTRDWRAHPEAAPATVSKLVSVEAHPSESLRAVTWHFDVQSHSLTDAQGGARGVDAPLRRVTAQFDLRTFTLGELDLAGRLAGLEVSGAWGDYDLTPYDDGAQRLVVAFTPAEGDA